MHSELFKKICNIILDILIGIFGLILLITVYNNVQIKVFNKDYADFFGYSTFEVQTGSMTPTIKPNDLVIVKKEDSPKIRDIITYKKGNAFITHRIVEAYRETYITKGDANNAKDEAIGKNQIVGKVVKIIPNFGAVRKTLLNPFVLITLIVTIYLISRIFSNKESSIKVLISKLQNKKKEEPKEEIKEVQEEVAVLVEPTEEIKEEEKIEEVKEVIEEPIDEEDETEKTMYFRTISVDSEELNPVIAPPVLIEEEEPTIKEDDIEEQNEEEKVKEIKKKHKKFNSIIEKVVSIKEDELSEIIDILSESKLKPNEATIKDTFMKIYMDGKYYNHCGNVIIDHNPKNVCQKLEQVLNKESSKMIKQYKGNDYKYESKVIKYRKLFAVLTSIEQSDLLYEDIETKAANYKKKITKYLKFDDKKATEKTKEIISIQRVYKKIFNDTVNSTETNMFQLNYNQLSSRKNIYGLVLDHNIIFSKVYSNYIINKTYDEGVVAEDKVLVILNLLLSKLAQDMMEGNSKNKYLLYLPSTLYDKVNKLNNILKILDNEYVKNSVLILTKSSVISKKKAIFKDIKKQGYQIAIVYDNNPIEANDCSAYNTATYLFIDNQVKKTLKLNLIDPNIIIGENILDKVDIPVGGEE